MTAAGWNNKVSQPNETYELGPQGGVERDRECCCSGQRWRPGISVWWPRCDLSVNKRVTSIFSFYPPPSSPPLLYDERDKRRFTPSPTGFCRVFFVSSLASSSYFPSMCFGCWYVFNTLLLAHNSHSDALQRLFSISLSQTSLFLELLCLSNSLEMLQHVALYR